MSPASDRLVSAYDAVTDGRSDHGTLEAAKTWVPVTPLGRLSARTIDWIPGPRLVRAHQVSSGIVLWVANAIGAVIVVVLNVLVIPGRTLPEGGTAQLVSLLVIGGYVLVAFPIGGVVIYRHSNGVWRWLAEDRPPTDEEEREILRSPLHALRVLLVLWMIGVLIATILGAVDSWRLAVHIFVTTLIGGVTTSAFGYVLAERTLRPVARVVLEHSTASSPVLPGTATRQLLTWALGTGSPVFGVWIVGLLALTGANPATDNQLARAMIVLASITLTAGLLAEVVTARAVADPIVRMRGAVRKLTAGDLSARVPIDDATEVGLLQAGFNQMAVGIQEREELRDLFGRHVGGEVAATALARGVELGGESVEVGAMFVDVVGSTSLAMERPATEVVELINRFFDVVIEVTERHGGLVNKFAGDGALIVFGA
ncbi:MAG: adenylate/guanylate cyclase domain-containing protein, partial [Solirubrobacteraceae bacterium]|nr:adenylate/guanylate cyclase domain-containing protein [Patulibacter sp.]